MFKFIIKTFDQLKKYNFDQVKFGLTTPCQWNKLNGQIIFKLFVNFFAVKYLSILIVKTVLSPVFDAGDIVVGEGKFGLNINKCIDWILSWLFWAKIL